MNKAVVISALILSLSMAGSSFAFTVKLSPQGEAARWPCSAASIFYVVNPSGPGSDPAILSALDEAFRSWSRAAGGGLAFVFSGQTAAAVAERDGVNTLFWVDREWRHGADVVAMASVWYADRKGTIEEADIEFNARDYRWSLDGRDGSLPLPEIARHEIGHLLGVDHSFNPSAAMHGSVSPGLPVRTALSRDDVEAAFFLYPSGSPACSVFDLPVLFYPRDFPETSPVRSFAGLESFGRAPAALGSLDVDGDGIRAEAAVVWSGREGAPMVELFSAPSGDEKTLIPLAPGREIEAAGGIIAAAGGDFDRDGRSRELAILFRLAGRENVRVYSWPAAADDGPRLIFSRPLQAPPADNVVGMTVLDANRDGLRDEIAILRSTGRGYVAVMYPPLSGGGAALSGERLALPGLQKGSRLLGLSGLDADGDGEERELAVLERLPSGQCWLHAFRPSASGLSYLVSSPAPEVKGAVSPSCLAAVDFNRDGVADEALLLSLQ
jgi:hypothetical protein